MTQTPDTTRQQFKERVLEQVRRVGVAVVSVSIRSMRAKWASCSTNGRLNFNDELLALDDEVRDYVIIHELVHLKVPNHGKLWKALMLAYCPNYKAIAGLLPVVTHKME